MRWIFFTLLMANLAAFAWGVVVASGAENLGVAVAKHKKKPVGVPTVVLLSEEGSGAGGSQGGGEVEESSLPSGEKHKDVAVSVARSLIEPVSSLESKNVMCDMVGPFSDPADAHALVERLGAIEVLSKIKNIELPAGERYQVFLPSLPSKEEAFRRLAELQANGVDSYVIRKGEKANSISLGLFRKRSFAEAHLKHLQSLGLNPSLDVIADTVRELWVVLNPGEGSKMSKSTWKNTMEGINFTERRKNICIDVASGENFH